MSLHPFAVLSILIASELLVGCSSAPTTRHLESRAVPARPIFDTRATYCSAPRNSSGRVDVDRLIAELTDIGANTYSFCIHGSTNDWDDLQLILPKARKKGIRIWASIVPPSESPPRTKMYAEPFRLDYQRWAVEFAKLSLREPNLVAWSIDDFTHNLKFYTPDYVKQMQDKAHQINPRLAFVPCCYYPAITANFMANYGPLLDGILFPYRHESAGANLKDADLVEAEVQKIKSIVGKDFPVVLDIYASAHSRLGATTAEYVEQAMIAGHRAADGVMIYRHQDPVRTTKSTDHKKPFPSLGEPGAYRAAVLSWRIGNIRGNVFGAGAVGAGLAPFFSNVRSSMVPAMDTFTDLAFGSI